MPSEVDARRKAGGDWGQRPGLREGVFPCQHQPGSGSVGQTSYNVLGRIAKPIQVSPAAVRARLRALADAPPAALAAAHPASGPSADGGEEDAESGGDHPTVDGAPAAALPPAAVVLTYCLSDLGLSGGNDPQPGAAAQPAAPDAGAVARELSGLRLLPLADGGLQGIQPRGAAARGGPAPADPVFVPADDEERALLAPLTSVLVAPGLGGPLTARLLALTDLRATNVRRVDCAAMDAFLLPRLLPPEWKGKCRVDADAVAAAADAFPGGQAAWAAWLPRLWRWLAARADAAALTSWPLVPLLGGALMALEAPPRALRGGGAWHESLVSALTRMGCPLVDEAALAAAEPGVAASPALQLFSQPGTAGGVLEAIGAAAVAASDADGAGAGGPTQAAWRARLSGLTPAERRQLRSFLLQARWFGGVADGTGTGRRGAAAAAAAAAEAAPGLLPEQTSVLRKLPIYETHPPLPHERAALAQMPSSPQQPALQPSQQQAQAQQQDRDPQQEQEQPGIQAGAHALAPGAAAPAAASGDAGGAAGTGRFLSLVFVAAQGVSLPPPGAPHELLGARFLRCESEAEEAALSCHLSVPRLTASQFLRHHVAPSAAALDHDAVAGAVAAALRSLRQRGGDDPGLADVLRWGPGGVCL